MSDEYVAKIEPKETQLDVLTSIASHLDRIAEALESIAYELDQITCRPRDWRGEVADYKVVRTMDVTPHD